MPVRAGGARRAREPRLVFAACLAPLKRRTRTRMSDLTERQFAAVLASLAKQITDPESALPTQQILSELSAISKLDQQGERAAAGAAAARDVFGRGVRVGAVVRAAVDCAP